MTIVRVCLYIDWINALYKMIIFQSHIDAMGNISCDFSDIDQCGYVDTSYAEHRWTRKYNPGEDTFD